MAPAEAFPFTRTPDPAAMDTVSLETLTALDSLLREEELLARDTVRKFVAEKVLPDIGDHFENHTFPDELTPQMAEMGMQGPANTLPMMGGEGPVGSVGMGGMFTILKVRDDIETYDDPGWYEHPEGTVSDQVGGEPGSPPREPATHEQHMHHGG